MLPLTASRVALDGTEVTITPSEGTLAGNEVPASPANSSFVVSLDEGDIVEVMTKTLDKGLTGTWVVSDEEHPVAVFTGNECTFIPTNIQACDHLEEQLSGVRLWGQHFIASRVPPRSATPDTSLWQIYASEDGTTITFAPESIIHIQFFTKFDQKAFFEMEFASSTS